MKMRRVLVGAAAAAAWGAPAAMGSIIAYDNTPNATFSNAIVSGTEWADDLHMVQGGMLDSFTFEFEQSTSSSVTIRFYTNDATNTTMPGPGTLIATFPGIGVSGGGSSGSRTVNVTPGIVLPQHIWMSFQYNVGGQLKLHNPPTVGSSSSALSVAPGFDNYPFNWGGNFPFQVVVTPSPGAGAILCVAGFVGLRRRRA